MTDEPIYKIETDIDKFYKLIQQKGVVSLKEACSALNLQKKQINKYVDILTKPNKIKAKYPLLGQPLFYIEDTSKQVNPAKSAVSTAQAPKEANTQKHCKQCGNPLKDNAKFCTKCGSEVKE